MKSSSQPVLNLNQVSKQYPGNPPVQALIQINMAINKGELVGVVGASGSGKTTLLHIMGTLDQPSSGTVEISGFDSEQLSSRQLASLRAFHIGFVFQQFFLLNGTTAIDNVGDGLLYTGMKLRDRRRRALTALERVGLSHRLDHKPAQMSGGERQRVAIARALVGEPSIVLADEPTGNLDSRSSENIVALLEELNREGVTIAIITHNPEIADRFPRTIGIRDGRIEWDRANSKKELVNPNGS